MKNFEVRRVEIETRERSGNEMWFDEREGRITAAKFHTSHKDGTVSAL